MPGEPSPGPRLPTRSRLLLALIAAAGLAIFTTGYLHTRARQSRELEKETTLVRDQVQIRLREWIRTRRLAVETFATQLAGVPLDDPASYRRQAEQVTARYGGFQALNWVTPEGVIAITAPEVGNEGALGRNLFAHEGRGVAAALRGARDRPGAFLRTPVVMLLQDRRGFGSYLAIRDASGGIRGYLNAVFVIQELVDGCLAEPSLRDAFQLTLREADEGEQAYPDGAEVGSGAWRFAQAADVPAFDRPWRLEIAPTDEHISMSRTWVAGFVFLTGIVGLFAILLLIRLRMLRRLDERDTEARHRSLITDVLDASRVGITVTDASGRIVWMNHAQEVFFGVERSPVLGRPMQVLLRAYRSANVVANTDTLRTQFAAPAGSDDAGGLVHVLGTPDRQTRWLEHRSAAIRSGLYAGGRVDHFHDVTRRKEAEGEHAQLATAIEQSSEMIWITDADGAMVYVNPVLQEITGYTREEALGRVPRLLEVGDQVEDLWTTIRDGRTWRGKYTAVRPDGSSFHADAAVSPVRRADGTITHFVGVVRDVTREHALEDQLRQSQKMEAVGKLAGGVAHDFNNILQVIMGRGHLAMSKALDGESDVETIQEIVEASERAADLTKQLLAFGRRQVLRRTVIAPNQLVSEHLRMLRRLIGEDIDLQVHLFEPMGNVRADRTQLEQVLMNLCVNAREAMPDGGTVSISTQMARRDGDRIMLGCGPVCDHAVIEVKDTGIGISPEHLPSVFDPFFSTKETGKGSGLGLSTVYGIVRQHDGIAEIESRVGEGTTVRFALPCVAEEVARPEPAPAEAPPTHGTETILVVEDDMMVRGLAVTVLEEAGYRVRIAEDGEEALALIQRKPDAVDLVFSDVVMPKMGGEALAEAIRETGARAAILLTSGYRGGVSGRAEPSRFPTLPKPYAPKDMLAKIREVLDAADSAVPTR